MAGTPPTPTMIRQAWSAAIRHSVSQSAALENRMKVFLKATVVIKATIAAVSCPRPCIEKTAEVMAPRHLVGANLDQYLAHILQEYANIGEETYSEVMTDDSG